MNGHFPCDANNYHTIPSDGLNVSMVIDLIWHPSGLPAPEHWALVLVKLSDSCMCSKSLHLRPTLCKPMDYSPPGSSVHGIFQARILEWVVIPFSNELPNPEIKPRSPALQADSLPSMPPGKPQNQSTISFKILQGLPWRLSG